MSISNDDLIAFLNGQLPEAQLADIEAALLDDTDLAARLEALAEQHAQNGSAIDQAVRTAFDRILEEPVPPALLAAASPVVVDLAAARAARQPARSGLSRWWQPAAMAASLAIGVLIGTGVPGVGGRGGDPLIIADAAGTRAGPSLAAALSSARSGTDARVPGGVMRPVITVRAGDGRLCRQFGIQQDQAAMAALACRSGEQWQIVVASSSNATRNDYSLAAGPAEAAITAALDSLQAGEPLDAAGEASALAKR
jgi:hypothetical protein